MINAVFMNGNSRVESEIIKADIIVTAYSVAKEWDMLAHDRLGVVFAVRDQGSSSADPRGKVGSLDRKPRGHWRVPRMVGWMKQVEYSHCVSRTNVREVVAKRGRRKGRPPCGNVASVRGFQREFKSPKGKKMAGKCLGSAGEW